MSLFLIILLIIFGLILVILEIMVLPGFIAGAAGVICVVTGVVLAYNYHGTFIGNILLVLTAISSALLLYLAFNSSTWKKVTLTTSLEGKVAKSQKTFMKGDRGITLSRLAPSGKAQFIDAVVEVQSWKDFIDENTEIEIIKIDDNNKIIVKPVS